MLSSLLWMMNSDVWLGGWVGAIQIERDFNSNIKWEGGESYHGGLLCGHMSRPVIILLGHISLF